MVHSFLENRKSKDFRKRIKSRFRLHFLVNYFQMFHNKETLIDGFKEITHCGKLRKYRKKYIFRSYMKYIEESCASISL